VGASKPGGGPIPPRRATLSAAPSELMLGWWPSWPSLMATVDRVEMPLAGVPGSEPVSLLIEEGGGGMLRSVVAMIKLSICFDMFCIIFCLNVFSVIISCL